MRRGLARWRGSSRAVLAAGIARQTGVREARPNALAASVTAPTSASRVAGFTRVTAAEATRGSTCTVDWHVRKVRKLLIRLRQGLTAALEGLHYAPV
jgi:hypothetical protein